MDKIIEAATEIREHLRSQRRALGVVPQLMSKSIALAGGDIAKGREIASIAAECADIVTIREWAKGITTQPGGIVYDPQKAYAYVYTGKDPMTHSNQTFYPGAAGVYYWAIIPEMYEGTKVYPNITGIIVAVRRDEIWWNSVKKKKYRWNAADWNVCDRYPGEPGVNQWVEEGL